MKRITTLFIYLLVYISGISAQTSPTSIQGIPYDFEVLPVAAREVNPVQNSAAGRFTFEDVRFWVGEGENQAALVIDWYDEDETALVWGYRWDGEAYGIDMFVAIAQADPRLLLLTQETNLGYTVGGIGYNSTSRKDLILNYELASALADRNISFGFDEPNVFLGQTSVPTDPLQEIMDAIGAGMTTGVVYHPLNFTNYGYACYDYDHWNSSNPAGKWKSAWYTGYWSYMVRDNSEETFMYSGLGATLRKLTNGSWDAWGFQDGWDSWAGVDPREPFMAVLSWIPVMSVSVSPEQSEMKVNEELQLTAVILPENATNKSLEWRSNDPEIATVNEQGLVKAITEGEVTVSVISRDGEYVGNSLITVTGNVNAMEEIRDTFYKVYPTITKGMITVSLQETASLILKDMAGRTLLSMVSDSPGIQISLDGYPNGIYFLVINNQITKIIKN